MHPAEGAGAVVHDHAVEAHQPEDQRRDCQGTVANLGVGDQDTGLHRVANRHVFLHAGVDGLDVHAALGDLAAFDPQARVVAEDRQDGFRDVLVLDPVVAVAEQGAGFAVDGAEHPAARLRTPPVVHVERQQAGGVFQHPVVILGRDAGALADLAVRGVADREVINLVVAEFEDRGALLRGLHGHLRSRDDEVLLGGLLPFDFHCEFGEGFASFHRGSPWRCGPSPVTCQCGLLRRRRPARRGGSSRSGEPSQSPLRDPRRHVPRCIGRISTLLAISKH